MARIIEAQAIISAKDATGDTLARIAAKFKGLDQSVAQLAAKRLSGAPYGIAGLDKLVVSAAQIDKVRDSWERLNVALAKQPNLGAHAVIGAQQRWRADMVSNLRAVRTEYERLTGAQHRFNLASPMRNAAAVLGLGSAAYAANRVGRNTIAANAQFMREQARNELAGMTPAETERTAALSREYSARYRSLDAAQIQERIRNLRSFTGSLSGGEALLDPVLQAQTVLQSVKGKDQAASELQRFIKGLDIIGRNDDPDSIKRLLNAYTKALGVDSDLNMGDFALMARYAKSGGSALSDEFLGAVAPTLLQDIGGQRLGTMLGSEISQNIGNRATKEAKAAQVRAGVRDKAGFVDKDLMLSNPYAWTQKHLPAAMARLKLDPSKDEDVIKFTSELFSNQMVADMFTKMWTQRGQIERSRELYGKAPGLEAAAALGQRDPYVALESFLAQARNLATQVADPVFSKAAGMLDALAGSIASFTQKLGADKELNSLVSTGTAAAGGAAAAFAGGTALKWAGGWLSSLWNWRSAQALAGEIALPASRGLLASAGGALGTAAPVVGGGIWAWGLLDEIEKQKREGRDFDSVYRARNRSDHVPESGLPPLTLDAVRGALQGSNIKAELEGKADVSVNVRVDPSPDFLAKVQSRIDASGHLRANGSPGAIGTSGSTGPSMPETGMHP